MTSHEKETCAFSYPFFCHGVFVKDYAFFGVKHPLQVEVYYSTEEPSWQTSSVPPRCIYSYNVSAVSQNIQLSWVASWVILACCYCFCLELE